MFGASERKELVTVRSCLLIATCFLMSIVFGGAEAAKPTGSGNSSNTTSTVLPVFEVLELDYVSGSVKIRGRHLVEGDPTNPVLPQLHVGGRAVTVDEGATVSATDFSTGETTLVVSFDEILAVLDDLVQSTPSGDELPPGDNLAIKVTTSAGVAYSSVFIAEPVRPSTAPPPPPTTGSCPCSTYYDQYYVEKYALLWPICTAPGSSNLPVTGPVPVEQYIEASFIDELTVTIVAIGSDSSSSPRSTLAGTCYARTGDYWPLPEQPSQFLEPPIPISDEDHLACVADIIAREAICRGGNWLDP